MYNLLGYSLNYSVMTGILLFYSEDEATNVNADIANNNDFKSFKCKTKLVEKRVPQPAPNNNNGILETATIAVPLIYLSNFWRKVKMSWINCKVKLKLKWAIHFILAATGIDNLNANDNNTMFTKKYKKLYVPAVTLSAKDN